MLQHVHPLCTHQGTKLGVGIHVFALVFAVRFQRLFGPRRQSVQRIIFGIVEAKVVRQLAPDHAFFKKGSGTVVVLGLERQDFTSRED